MSHRLARLSLIAAVSALALAACNDDNTLQANAFPLAQIHPFDQPIPTKPLFSQPIITLKQVLPKPEADSKQPLPPAVALAPAAAADAAAAPASAAATPDSTAPSASQENKDGAVNPAAGQAAAVTDSQGAAHTQDGSK